MTDGADIRLIQGAAQDVLPTLPLIGSGTTGVVARLQGRDCIGIELSEQHYKVSQGRLQGDNVADLPLFVPRAMQGDML